MQVLLIRVVCETLSQWEQWSRAFSLEMTPKERVNELKHTLGLYVDYTNWCSD